MYFIKDLIRSNNEKNIIITYFTLTNIITDPVGINHSPGVTPAGWGHGGLTVWEYGGGVLADLTQVTYKPRETGARYPMAFFVPFARTFNTKITQ